MADEPKPEWKLAPTAISKSRREAARQALDRLPKHERTPYTTSRTDLSKPLLHGRDKDGNRFRTMEPLIDKDGDFMPRRDKFNTDPSTDVAVSNVLDRGSHGDVRPEMIQIMGERATDSSEMRRQKRLLEDRVSASEGSRDELFDFGKGGPVKAFRDLDPQDQTDVQRERLDSSESPASRRSLQDQVDYLKRFYGTK